MGRTLFWYIFKDLVKIFFMASGALAGILSFGGLLRPLTQQGLDAGQVGKILSYFTPAMTTYSFPVAALFATTVVYGRLSADNELTACRAGGIGLGPFLGMAFPAVMFGLIVAIVSLLFLCFVVPVYTLKVEKVIYSNLAKLIATRIERTHKIEFGTAEIYAQKATIPPPDPHHPGQQRVILEAVSIVAYQRPDRTDPRFRDPHFKLPREFWLASSATVNIDDRPNRGVEKDGNKVAADDVVRLLIGLDGGSKFPRELSGGMQAGVGRGQFGPMEINSPIKEDPKFMTVGRLKWLFEHPEKSRRIGTVVAGFVRRDQQLRYLQGLADELNQGDREVSFTPRETPGSDPANDPASDTSTTGEAATGDKLSVSIADDVAATVNAALKVDQDSELSVTGIRPNAIRLVYQRPNEAPTRQEAKDLRIRARPDSVDGVMNVTIELLNRTPAGATRPMSGQYSELVNVPMPPELAALEDRTVGHYTNAIDPETRKPPITPGDLAGLNREMTILDNGILAESNSRASFAVSCLILVMVGCALGMMFRSGNFLTAFAVSFIPALLCITLIVAGQQTCHSVPFRDVLTHNPLKLGLGLIWSGNAINTILAISLLCACSGSSWHSRLWHSQTAGSFRRSRGTSAAFACCGLADNL